MNKNRKNSFNTLNQNEKYNKNITKCQLRSEVQQRKFKIYYILNKIVITSGATMKWRNVLFF